MPNPEVISMITTLVGKVVRHKLTSQPSTLRHVLEALDITPFTPESVAQYKREKLEQVASEFRPADAEEIKEREFGGWEYAELHRLRKEIAPRNLPGNEPVIRFWKTPLWERFYTCLRWVKSPLEKVADVPEFVKAKAAEIATHLPEATFSVEELRSERRVYDPFLIVSYGDESYYVEVWDEKDFERKYT
jgi:hypothetical protein